MTDPTGSAGRGRLSEVLATRGGRADPEAPFVIEHREALIYMLCEAAELEHGIMCQYLFAAFSLKQRVDEGLTAEQLETVTRWRKAISHVATEEMLHLALVHNLLSAIGAAPHFGRPNLPAPAHHYPAGVNLTLVPLGEQNLFVGPSRAQATTENFSWPELVPVTDLASAQQAIDTILEQGEGARGDWQHAHFGQFVQILDEYREMVAANPEFDPVRPVMFATVR